MQKQKKPKRKIELFINCEATTEDKENIIIQLPEFLRKAKEIIFELK